ncbi:hypothetical protein M1466_03255 [Candidatus Dependentiae bacterium]|nr:hypothetical protein [Candidatus Dependentiae bacterium]
MQSTSSTAERDKLTQELQQAEQEKTRWIDDSLALLKRNASAISAYHEQFNSLRTQQQAIVQLLTTIAAEPPSFRNKLVKKQRTYELARLLQELQFTENSINLLFEEQGVISDYYEQKIVDCQREIDFITIGLQALSLYSGLYD